MQEAMALAAMNPVVSNGPTGNGVYIVDNLNHDKDLDDKENNGYMVTNSLDNSAPFVGLDQNHKLVTKDKSELYESNTPIVVYRVLGENVEKGFERLVEELSKPYENREIHDDSYIYECLTGGQLLYKDQFKYDPLLEEIQLKKLSRILSSNDDKTESKPDKYDPEEPEGDVPARSIEPYDVDGAVGTGLLAAADLLFVDDDFDY